jgi:hypothetical protein
MIVTKDLWLTLTPKQRLEKLTEALSQLKEIGTKNSRLKVKVDQGRLANAKKDLEAFVINVVTWESDRQLQKYHG